MAKIKNVKLSAAKATGQGNMWVLTVTYDAEFSSYEVANFNFRDGFVVWERDPAPNPDDRLTGLVGISEFNPTVTPTKRTMKHTISGATLNTEQGVHDVEELYVEVAITNLDLDISTTQKSITLHLNP